ncbi:AaceriADR039Wp [[Ashbya] aceris (nom. inval.)]|nr:AaceriADR039Wp [[Ashbya] aceris (nom. inval.)]
MFRTNLFQNKIDAYSNKTAKRKLFQLYEGDDREVFEYLSDRGTLKNPDVLETYLDNAAPDVRDFHQFVGRLLCLYDITHDQYVYCSTEFRQNARNILFPRLERIFEIDSKMIGALPLRRCYKRIKQRFDNDLQEIVYNACEQRRAIEGNWIERQVQADDPAVSNRFSAIINWENQECLDAGAYDRALQDNIVTWFMRMNKKVIEKLSARTSKFKTLCKSWFSVSRSYCYWSVLECVMQSEHVYYEFMLEKLKKKAELMTTSSQADGEITIADVQLVVDQFKELETSFSALEEDENLLEDISSSDSSISSPQTLIPITNQAHWKKPKPHIEFAGKVTRIYHPFQTPGDYLLEVPHHDSLAPGPLDIDTTYQQFSTRFRDLMVIYLRWDFVQKSGQSPGTGPFGWFFLMFRNGDPVPVYITERVHKVVFEKPEEDENLSCDEEQHIKMEWPNELKMPVCNTKRWEGRSVYIPMDEFAKDLVFRSKEAAVNRYYHTLGQVRELECL